MVMSQVVSELLCFDVSLSYHIYVGKLYHPLGGRLSSTGAKQEEGRTFRIKLRLKDSNKTRQMPLIVQVTEKSEGESQVSVHL